MYSILNEENPLQLFFYLVGEGGTETTIIRNVFTVLIGLRKTLTTSLEALSHVKFEAFFVKTACLIKVNDVDDRIQDMGMLNILTGQETIKIRSMYSQDKNELDLVSISCSWNYSWELLEKPLQQ